jgi:uncharacterized repeat protein (TIGR01451 family)
MRPPRRALCAFALLALAPSAARAATSPVAAENALPGTVQGLLPATATGGSIEGYASEVSALPGDTIHLHVSTSPAAPYRIEVYRLGWYGGTGSRLVGCVPSCGGFEQGQPQPPPTVRADGLVQAGWPVTDSFQLPPDAVSGYYRVRFLLASGQAAATFVIVRAPPGVQSAILVQVPVNTWEAYNAWGGRSLYDLPGAARANRVSFDRPYAWTAPGNQNPFGWEYPLVAFLEQSGYDVSYQTDLDTDRDPSSLLGHRLVLSIGHDEYWTQAMRDAFEAARDQGVNLAFMGANDVYWRIRYEDGGRTIVDYKSGDDPVTDPRLRTGYFRVLDAPECELVGIQHQGGELNWPPGDYAVVPAALASPLGRRWFAGTGLGAGSVVRGVVGVETDTIPAWDRGASCGHALTVFFHHEGGGDQSGNADATAYTAPSGAVVFAAGSKRLAWGLADPPALTGRAHGLVDPRLQRFVRNLLDDLSARRVADLTVTLRPAAASVPTGGRVEVRLVVENEGPDPASAATLTVSLPPGLRFVRVASRALRCTLAPLRCALAEIEPGARVAATFTLRATAAGRQPVTARAFTLLAADPEPASATDTVAIVCHRPPDPAAAGTSPG